MPNPPQDHKNHDQRVFIYLLIIYHPSSRRLTQRQLTNKMMKRIGHPVLSVRERAGICGLQLARKPQFTEAVTDNPPR